MKLLSESKALEQLKELKSDYQLTIRAGYEHRAKDCLTCEVQGSCCTDAHFVNVQITRLEAKAIDNVLRKLDEEKRNAIIDRAKEAVEKYNLGSGGETYSCPLFEKGTGCLVHKEAKPAPCIQHACYERKEDLPPDLLQFEQEAEIQKLNEQTYGSKWTWATIPVWIANVKE